VTGQRLEQGFTIEEARLGENTSILNIRFVILLGDRTVTAAIGSRRDDGNDLTTEWALETDFAVELIVLNSNIDLSDGGNTTRGTITNVI